MWSFSIGGGGLSESGSGVDPDSSSCGRSEGAPCMLVRFRALPRPFGGSPIKGECSPSSSVSLIVGASLSKRLLAALSRLKLFASASRSLRLRSRLLAFRSSFSKSRPHQPARASQRWARTFSMTMSMSTPAARIRWRTSFSSSVVKGAGCCSFKISCCRGACSANHGFCRISASEGLKMGRFESKIWHKSFAWAGKFSGYTGSSFSIFIFVTISSSSSKGSSPTKRA